jgi:hypothetical protein
MISSCFSALDALQHGAVGPTPDRIRGDQPGRPGLACDDLGARLLEPIDDQVGPGRHTAGIEPVEGCEIGVTQGVAFLAPPQKRRIPHDDIRRRPFWFRPIRIHDGIPLLDGIQRLEDRVLGQREAVREHPLDLADPDRDPRQFRRVGVELDPEHRFRTDQRE